MEAKLVRIRWLLTEIQAEIKGLVDQIDAQLEPRRPARYPGVDQFYDYTRDWPGWPDGKGRL
jgi:hypothetical protein